MADLEQNLNALAGRTAAENKSLRTLINGNLASLAALATTAKTNLVAAINELVTSVAGKESLSNKGAANGYAPLDGSTKIPSTYLPGYVDDVLEYANVAALPATGEPGKIYLTLDTTPAKEHRWTGSQYQELTSSPGSSDAVPEGSTNKYFTDSRAIAALAPSLGNTEQDLVAVFNAGLI